MRALHVTLNVGWVLLVAHYMASEIEPLAQYPPTLATVATPYIIKLAQPAFSPAKRVAQLRDGCTGFSMGCLTVGGHDLFALVLYCWRAG